MASLAELERIIAASGDRLAAHVVVFRPTHVATDWERTGLWDQAAAIPGITVWTDGGGVEAKRFGAATSGLVLVYDASGKLMFQGGITRSRGHQGDNDGSTAVMRLIASSALPETSTPVFGCPLLGHQQTHHEDEGR